MLIFNISKIAILDRYMKWLMMHFKLHKKTNNNVLERVNNTCFRSIVNLRRIAVHFNLFTTAMTPKQYIGRWRIVLFIVNCHNAKTVYRVCSTHCFICFIHYKWYGNYFILFSLNNYTCFVKHFIDANNLAFSTHIKWQLAIHVILVHCRCYTKTLIHTVLVSFFIIDLTVLSVCVIWDS